MLRKEIVEKLRILMETVNRFGLLLLIVFLLTLSVDLVINWRLGDSLGLKILHWSRNIVDVVILLLLISERLFNHFVFVKQALPVRQMLKDDKLNRKIRDWLTSNAGDQLKWKVEFSSLSNIDEYSDLNYEAFKDTAFAIEKKKLFARNRAWAIRHPRIFMRILDPHSPNYHSIIGYSAMLPLTADGLQLYLDGALKDADIPPSLVARDRKSAAGVLLFAIHLRKEYSFAKSHAALGYSYYFLGCVQYHLRSLFAKRSKRAMPYPPIYVQTEMRSLKRMLYSYGFVSTGRKSADGFEILIFKQELGNPLDAV